MAIFRVTIVWRKRNIQIRSVADFWLMITMMISTFEITRIWKLIIFVFFCIQQRILKLFTARCYIFTFADPLLSLPWHCLPLSLTINPFSPSSTCHKKLIIEREQNFRFEWNFQHIKKKNSSCSSQIFRNFHRVIFKQRVTDQKREKRGAQCERWLFWFEKQGEKKANENEVWM